MPQIVNGKLTKLHGEETLPIGPALPFNGGIFGQPKLPQPRSGNFHTRYALPWQDMIDATGSNRDTTLTQDTYAMSSGIPTTGVIPKRRLGAPGLGVPFLGTEVPTTVLPLVLGALAGYYAAPKSKKVLGAFAGAAGGAGGWFIGGTVGAVAGALLMPILIAKTGV